MPGADDLRDWRAAQEAMCWLYETLTPGVTALDLIPMTEHLRELGRDLPSTITTTHLGDPEAFTAELERTAEVFTPAKLKEWIAWCDDHGGDPMRDLRENLLPYAAIPVSLIPYLNDIAALREAIRALPEGQ